MLLVNKTQRIIQLSEVNHENPHAAPTLIPVVGTIELNDERWEKIKYAYSKDGKSKKEHPTIKAMIDEGWLEEINAEKKKALADLKPKDALEVVESTVDMKMLEMWKATEKRKPVFVAIQNQIKRLKGESVEADQSSDEVDA